MRILLKHRVPALALLLAITLSLLSCGYEPIERTEEEARVVGTIESYEVTYDQLRYITMIYKERIEAVYGEDVWDDAASREKYGELLRSEVGEAIKQDYAVIKLARSIGYSPEDADIIKNVNEYISEFVKELGGMRKYEKYLEENYMSDAFLRLTITTDYLESALLYAYCEIGYISNDMTEIFGWIEDEDLFLRTRHIFISSDKEGRSDAEAKALADAAYAELRGGADFAAVMEKYNEDTDIDTEVGMYFTHGEVDEDYEDAAKVLRRGNYSEVISAGGGYMIVERLEIDVQYVMMNISSFIDRYQYAALDEMIVGCRNELVFEPNEFFKTLDLTEME